MQLRQVNLTDLQHASTWRRPARVDSPPLHQLLGWVASFEHHRDVVVPLERSTQRVFQPDPYSGDGRYPRMQVPLKEALQRVAASPDGAHHYYLSNVDLDHFFPALNVQQRISAIFRHARFRTYLFWGPDRSGTAIHYDAADVLVWVVSGEKRIWLAAPDYASRLMPHSAVRNAANFSRLEVPPSEFGMYIHLKDGEGLIIPSLWWHYIENLGPTLSISVAFSVPRQLRCSWKYARVHVYPTLSRVKRGLVTGDWSRTGFAREGSTIQEEKRHMPQLNVVKAIATRLANAADRLSNFLRNAGLAESAAKPTNDDQARLRKDVPTIVIGVRG